MASFWPIFEPLLGTQKWGHFWYPEVGPPLHVLVTKGPKMGPFLVPRSGYQNGVQNCFFGNRGRFLLAVGTVVIGPFAEGPRGGDCQLGRNTAALADATEAWTPGLGQEQRPHLVAYFRSYTGYQKSFEVVSCSSERCSSERCGLRVLHPCPWPGSCFPKLAQTDCEAVPQAVCVRPKEGCFLRGYSVCGGAGVSKQNSVDGLDVDARVAHHSVVATCRGCPQRLCAWSAHGPGPSESVRRMPRGVAAGVRASSGANPLFGICLRRHILYAHDA